jgi:hypothetical protein
VAHVDAHDGDDRRFLTVVSKLVDTVPDDIRFIAVMRVDNWFDYKWLRFSGKGRIPFEWFNENHPGVSLTGFSQDKLTFPPFSPRRIVGQKIWFRDGDEPPGLVHPRVLQGSSWNLHRRVADFSDSIIAIWFSSRTEENGQGSVMQYSSYGGELEAWYASLRLKNHSWRVHLTKGIERERIEELVDDDIPPSGTTSRTK